MKFLITFITIALLLGACTNVSTEPEDNYEKKMVDSLILKFQQNNYSGVTKEERDYFDQTGTKNHSNMSIQERRLYDFYNEFQENFTRNAVRASSCYASQLFICKKWNVTKTTVEISLINKKDPYSDIEISADSCKDIVRLDELNQNEVTVKFEDCNNQVNEQVGYSVNFSFKHKGKLIAKGDMYFRE